MPFERSPVFTIVNYLIPAVLQIFKYSQVSFLTKLFSILFVDYKYPEHQLFQSFNRIIGFMNCFTNVDP